MPRQISNRRKEMGEENWALHQKELAAKKAKRYNSSSKTIESRIRKKRKLIDYKGGACQRCGLISEINDVYVFHHRNPLDKEFHLSRHRGTEVTFERCVKEVDKCDLLCCNCHAITHWELRYGLVAEID